MILLTGTSGFIGSVLLDKIIAKYGKNNVIALTSIKTNKCSYLLHNDYNFDKDFFIKSGYGNINTIIHAGAFIPKESNQSNDIFGNISSIINTSNILKSNLPNLKNIIFLSTVDVYESSNVLTELSNVNPSTLYGHSKLYCEKLISTYSGNNHILHQILRIGHVYGPGEEAFQKAIPVMLKKILNNETIQIFGSGNDIRSFIYIDNAVEAIINSIELKEFHGPINIVSNNKITIKDLAHLLIKIAKSKMNVEFIESLNTHKRDLIFDNSKMKKYLLKNEIDLELGLKNEYNHMKNLMS
jgi:UDP-glucose 4-epimerase